MAKGKKRRKKVRRARAWSTRAKQRVRRLNRLRKRRKYKRGTIKSIWEKWGADTATGGPGFQKLVRKMMGRLRRYRIRARGKTKTGRKKQGARDRKNLTKSQKKLLAEAKKFFKTGIDPEGIYAEDPDVINYGVPRGGSLVVAARRRRRRRRNPTSSRRSRRGQRRGQRRVRRRGRGRRLGRRRRPRRRRSRRRRRRRSRRRR